MPHQIQTPPDVGQRGVPDILQRHHRESASASSARNGRRPVTADSISVPSRAQTAPQSGTGRSGPRRGRAQGSASRTRDIGRPLRYEFLADDVAALLDHLGLDQADLVGYSLGAGMAMQVAIRHPGRVRRLAALSTSYRSDGLHAEMTAAVADDSALEQLSGSPYHRAYQAVAPDPEHWPELVQRVLDLDVQPQNWQDQIAGIQAPAMLVVADNDIVRLEHAVEMFHLLGGGIVGDLHALPAARLAVVPGTSHIGLSAVRRGWSR
jgi:pimeloyl-ACP methyl ester carboxylesterase